MNHTCLCLPSRPRRDGRLSWPWVNGWLHTEMSVRPWELNPNTVAHLSTNRSRRILTGTSFTGLTTWTSTVFTALHVMHTRYSDENSVCLSVCHTRELWQNSRKICPDLYTIWKNIYPSFLRRRMVWWGDTFYLKFWVNWPPLERNRRFSTNNRS